MVAKKKTESRLFKKLDQVHLMFGSGTSVFSKSHSESEKQISAQGSGNQKNKKSIEKLKGSLMYDIETEFESEESELRSQKSSIEDQESLMSRNELNRMLEVGSVSESEKSQESKKKEMDFSVFQVRKNKNSKSLWDEKEQNEPNESIAETDSENDFAENSTIGRLKIDQLSSISGDTDVGSHTSVKNSRRYAIFLRTGKSFSLLGI